MNDKVVRQHERKYQVLYAFVPIHPDW